MRQRFNSAPCGDSESRLQPSVPTRLLHSMLSKCKVHGTAKRADSLRTAAGAVGAEDNRKQKAKLQRAGPSC